MKGVLLFYPSLTNGKESPTLYTALPLSLIALAAQLYREELPVEILDERLHIYTESEIRDKLDGAWMVGISAITSYQIVNGLLFAGMVRRLAPDIPLVWGGWHPTLMPYETIRHELVDIVMMGQGEEILPSLARRLRDRRPPEDVPHILYKDKAGRIVETAGRETAGFQLKDNIIAGYAAVDLDLYIHPQWGHQRVVGYESSRGCPFQCSFCSIGNVYQRRWSGLPAESVVRDIAWLKEEQRIDAVHFFDNNFFLDTRRAGQIADGLAKRELGVAWDGTVVAQQFVRFTPAYIRRLKRGGLFRVIIGGESGDEEVLRRVHKGHTNGQILQAVRMCREFGLLPSLSFMIGFPWAPEEDTRRTVELIEKIKAIDRESEILLFIFSPYLGTPLYDVAREFGMQFPDSLEGWANFTYDKVNTPWISSSLKRRMARYLRFFGTSEPTGRRDGIFRKFHE